MPDTAAEFRQLLIADLALIEGLVKAHEVAAALITYWNQRDEGGLQLLDELRRVAGLDEGALMELEKRADRLIAEAGGNAQAALTRRGGIDRNIHLALSRDAGEVSMGLADVGAAARTPLAPLRPERYIDFDIAGEGGMGLVYLALDTELNRKVAFKIVRPDAGSGASREPLKTPMHASPPEADSEASGDFEQLRARFLQEAWVTGGMEHPGIVPVYELGQTPGGVPYYTMRFVRGRRTLADAIQEQREAPLEARLGLLEPFLKLCDAVRYAHSKGVIHRDLKPANVALGEFGEVVLLDWGLAKLAGREDIVGSHWQAELDAFRKTGAVSTMPGGMLGTPGYMAPEAALGEIDQVDAPSDVYSLGVILYEILTGHLPVSPGAYMAYIQTLLEGTPPRAMDVMPSVPRELSDLCERALSRGKDDRPDSARALAEAVRAWQAQSVLERELAAHRRSAEESLAAAEGLQGAALLAQVNRASVAVGQALELDAGDLATQGLSRRVQALQRDGLAQQERLARRRVWVRGGIAALVLATVAGFAVSAMLNVRREEAEAAKAAEAAARSEAEGLADFMLSDLREGLEPVGRLNLLEKVAYRALAYYEQRPVHAETDESRRAYRLALNNIGRVLQLRGKLEEARKVYEEALAISEALARSPSAVEAWERDVPVALRNLATVLEAQGDSDAALRLYKRSLERFETLSAQSPGDVRLASDVAYVLGTIGSVMVDRADSDAALEHHRASLAHWKRLAANNAQDVGVLGGLWRAHHELGRVLRVRTDLGAALESHERGLALAQRLRELHPGDRRGLRYLANSLDNVGLIHLSQGDYTKALGNFEEGRRIMVRLTRDDPFNLLWQQLLAKLLRQVAIIHHRRGELRESLDLHRQHLEIRVRLAATDPTNMQWRGDLADGHGMVAAVLDIQGDREAALRGYERAIEIRETIIERDPARANWQRSLARELIEAGRMLVELARPDDALAKYLRALAINERLAAADPADELLQKAISTAHSLIGDVHERRGDAARALASYEKDIAISRRLANKDPKNADWQRDLATSHHTIGTLLMRTGSLDRALEHFRGDLAITERLLEGDPRNSMRLQDLSIALRRLGDVLEQQGQWTDANAANTRAVSAMEQAAREDPTNATAQLYLAISYRDLSLTQFELGARDEAIATLRRAVELSERLAALDESSDWRDELKEGHFWLGNLLERMGRGAEALPHHARSLEIVSQLLEREPTHAIWRRQLAARRVRVSSLELVLEKRLPEGAGDHLLLAGALYRQRRYPESAGHYAKAIEDPTIRKDVNASHLYNAACAAALASAATGREGGAWRKRAMAWLTEDLRQRRALLARAAAEGASSQVREGLDRRYRLIYQHAQANDPDLASLRELPAFKALMAEMRPAD